MDGELSDEQSQSTDDFEQFEQVLGADADAEKRALGVGLPALMLNPTANAAAMIAVVTALVGRLRRVAEVSFLYKFQS